MTDYTEAGVRLVADVSDAESSIQNLLDMVSVFDSPISVDVSADTSAAESDLSALDTETIEPTVTPTYDDTNVLPFEDLATEEVEPTVTPVISDDGKSVLDTLKSIELMTAINLVINVAGNVIDFVQSWADFTAGPLLAIDTGMAEFQARTGAALPNARELITKILGEDLATGVTQITSVLTTAQQLHLPLEEAATSALTFTKVFPDNNPNTVLTTLDSMVKNNLVPDLTAGSDLLVAGFQQGANKGGDLLSVLGRNSSALKDLGLTGPSSLQLISNALAGGAADATSVVTALEKIKTNIMLQTTSGKGGALDTLAALNIPNPITSGQGWSADFFTAVSDAIKNAPVDDATKQQMFTSLVGGKLSQKDYQGFLNIDAAQGAFDNLKDTGKNAATVMDDSLTGAIDDFVLAAQVAATNFLSSDQIDLPGKMAALKTGLQDALNVLATGGDLGQALTIALKPIGFDDEFQSLESALGNFVIGILQAVASIQDLTGHGKEATGTRATIASMSANQLAFDLKVGNPDQVATDIATAVSRGVTPAQIVASASTAVSELVKSGATEQAQALVDQLKGGTFNVKASTAADSLALKAMGFSDNFQIPISPEMTPEAQQKFIADQEAAFKANGISIDISVAPKLDQTQIDDLQKQIDDAQLQATVGPKLAGAGNLDISGATATDNGHMLGLSGSVDDLKTKADAATVAQDALNAKVDTLGQRATTAQSPVTTLATAQQQVGTTAAAAVNPINRLIVPIDAIPQSANPATMSVIGLNNTLPPMTANLITANTALQNLSSTAQTIGSGGGGGSGVQPGKGHASGTEDTGGVGFWAGENGPEFITSDRSLAVLNNKTMSAIMAAISGAAGRGGVSNNSSSKQVNFTQNNFVPDKAVSDTLAYGTAKAIRGI